MFLKSCLLVVLLGACAIDDAGAEEAEAPTQGDQAVHAAPEAPPIGIATPPVGQAAPSPSTPAAAAGPCGESVAGGGWFSEAFTPPAGTQLEIELFAKVHEPSFQRVDMVLGLGRGPVDAFSDLATIVRFNADGNVDARNGSVYQAASTFRFRYDHLYAVRFVVDLAARRYSAYIRTYDTPGPGDLIASNYAFRTEQATTSSLDTFGHIVDSATGSLWACVQTIGP